MMMKEPKQRYSSWSDLMREIKFAQEGKPLPTRKPGKSTVAPLTGANAPKQARASEISKAVHKASKAQQRVQDVSPALGIFLKAFVFIALGILFHKLLDLPPKPMLRITQTGEPRPRTRQQQPETETPPATNPDYGYDDTPTTSSEPEQAPLPTMSSAETARTLSSVMDALLTDNADQARSILQDAISSGANPQLRQIGMLIDASESTDRLILLGFRAKKGQPATLNYSSRTFDIVVNAVSRQGVTATFQLPNGQQRETTFGIQKLNKAEQSRWIGPADTPVKAMAKATLLLQGGDLKAARAAAEEAGELAPLLTAEIDRRME
jgi:hypothetical protein